MTSGKRTKRMRALYEVMRDAGKLPEWHDRGPLWMRNEKSGAYCKLHPAKNCWRQFKRSLLRAARQPHVASQAT